MKSAKFVREDDRKSSIAGRCCKMHDKLRRRYWRALLCASWKAYAGIRRCVKCPLSFLNSIKLPSDFSVDFPRNSFARDAAPNENDRSLSWTRIPFSVELQITLYRRNRQESRSYCFNRLRMEHLWCGDILIISWRRFNEGIMSAE
jgi:hypothetical protein